MRKFHWKTPVLDSLFNKVLDFQACNFIKKIFQLECFPVKFAQFLRTSFFREHFRWLLLGVISSSDYHLWHIYKLLETLPSTDIKAKCQGCAISRYTIQRLSIQRLSIQRWTIHAQVIQTRSNYKNTVTLT